MKVAYLVAEYPRRSETFITSEIEAHRSAGLDVTVISLFRPGSSGTGDHLAPGIDVSYLDIDPRRAMRVCRAPAQLASLAVRSPSSAATSLRVGRYHDLATRLLVLGLLARWRWRIDHFDVIHSHFGPIGLLAVALRDSGRAGAALATTFHGIDVSEVLRRPDNSYYDRLFSTGDLFLPVSDLWATRLVAAGAPPERVIVQRMGINSSELQPPPRRSNLGHPIRIVSVGRLVEKKGHEFAIRALAHARHRLPESDVRLAIVGDGPLRSSLETLVRELGLAGSVTFLGAMPHDATLAEVSKSDIFVLASVTAATGDMEGIPVSLMEAMALGVPVLSTSHSGIPELIEDGVSGLLAAERDVKGLSENIQRLALRTGFGAQLAANGRETVETRFDTTYLGRTLRRRYKDLIEARADGIDQSGQSGRK